MIIDAHHHLWRPERGDYGWMTGAPDVLLRDYLPADLEPLLKRFGIAKTIVVQAAPTRAETDFLLQLAAETDFIAGVVGWLDMESEDFAAQLASYSRKPKFVGLRPMLQDLDDDAWILRPAVLRSLEQIAESGIAFDFLTFPRHLDHVATALEKVPGLRAVIDHISKPPIAAEQLDPWRDGIARVAAFEGVHCKISGMITEADPAHWRVSDIEPFVQHVANCFGPDRLMFGSDWPVCRLAGEYGDVLAAAMLALPQHMRGDPRIFATNAQRFYRI
ncbi:amidohydrolase [Mesorhizobium sp. Root554]|uniref:amidohydrolase family protein n=1 Tax=unclassified Mesorhizobium TaxID=325217 RepID=UPI0006F78C1E|nr:MULTISPECIES: amidohydrolase family protein [unclassified Mesorhizobium]KQZ12641.1 amidohydrolase [Mesorhizobium sp. Root1471]KQZ35163.1 amidohydrolase [Mesorhizobium sp. Root554]